MDGDKAARYEKIRPSARPRRAVGPEATRFDLRLGSPQRFGPQARLGEACRADFVRSTPRKCAWPFQCSIVLSRFRATGYWSTLVVAGSVKSGSAKHPAACSKP